MSSPKDASAELSKPTGEALCSEEQLIMAARLYYLDGLTQTQVAQLMGASQAKVSRMLTMAREREIVQISVPHYNPRDAALEESLRRTFGLADAIVIRRLEKQSVAGLRKFLGYYAAPYVSQWIPPASIVAVAAGRSTRGLADRLLPVAEGESPLTIVQCMGTIEETPGPYDAVEFGRLMARKLHGTLRTLDVPVLSEESTRAKLLAQRKVRETFQCFDKANVALVGVGNLHNSVFLERRILKPSAIEMLKRLGAVGEIVGRFYDVLGVECDSPYRNRVISIELDTLRRIERVIGVVAGCDRVDAILGAIRGNILKYLVLDDIAAASLLAAVSPARTK